MKTQILVTGEYPRDLPESLAKSLAFEVEHHMIGYGFKNVKVEVVNDDGTGNTETHAG